MDTSAISFPSAAVARDATARATVARLVAIPHRATVAPVAVVDRVAMASARAFAPSSASAAEVVMEAATEIAVHRIRATVEVATVRKPNFRKVVTVPVAWGRVAWGRVVSAAK